MTIRWTLEAALDLEEIADYLEINRPLLAQSTVMTLYTAAYELGRMLLRGRPGRRAGTRELVMHPLPYLLIYQVVDDLIVVLAFRHTSREPLPN